MIQNKNIENPSQKLISLSDNMFDYIVRLLVWAVEGGLRYRYTLYDNNGTLRPNRIAHHSPLTESVQRCSVAAEQLVAAEQIVRQGRK